MIDTTPPEPLRPDDPAYKRAHHAVHRLRGKAASCAFGCRGLLFFEWANLTGDYADPWDYAQMCRSCHERYDFTRTSMEPGFTGHHGMRRAVKATPDVTAEMIRRYESGDSIPVIARDMGVNTGTVSRAFGRAGFKVRNKTRDRLAEIINRYEAGDSTTAIARDTGINSGSISTTLRRAGVKVRSRSENTARARQRRSLELASVVTNDFPSGCDKGQLVNRPVMPT